MNDALSSKPNQLTTYTKTEVDDSFSAQLSQQIPGDLAIPFSAPIATGFPIIDDQIIHQGLSCSITFNHL